MDKEQIILKLEKVKEQVFYDNTEEAMSLINSLIGDLKKQDTL